MHKKGYALVLLYRATPLTARLTQDSADPAGIPYICILQKLHSHSMKFTVTSNDLLLQLQAVAKVINQKSVAAVPVLENILFELQGNILTLTAADQSNRLTCALEVNNLGEDGSFAVRSNIILDAIKELSDQPIEIDVDSEGGKATITYSNGHYSFLSTSADIYPQGIELDEARTIVMPAEGPRAHPLRCQR